MWTKFPKMPPCDTPVLTEDEFGRFAVEYWEDTAEFGAVWYNEDDCVVDVDVIRIKWHPIPEDK